jgi:hypothetical protein
MQNPLGHTLGGSFIEGFTIGAGTPHADQPLLEAASEFLDLHNFHRVNNSHQVTPLQYSEE